MNKKPLRGCFPSLTMDASITFLGSIERDFLYLVDRMPEVTHIQHEPFKIQYIADDGKSHTYTPDLHIIYRGSNRLIECKPESRLHNERNQRTFTAGQQWCAAQVDWSFSVVTETMLRRDYYVENVKLLTRYARCRILPEEIGQTLTVLTKHQQLPLDELSKLVSTNGPRHGDEIILYLLYHGYVSADLHNTPLSRHSIVTINVPDKEELNDYTQILDGHIFHLE